MTDWDEYHDVMQTVLRRTGIPRTVEDREAVANAIVHEMRQRGVWTQDAEDRLRAVFDIVR